MVDELSENPAPSGAIEPAQLGVTALIGHSHVGPVGEPVLCDSESAFNQRFGDWKEARVLAPSVHGFFQNGGQRAWVLNLGPVELELGPDTLAPLIDLVDIELVAAPGKCAPADYAALTAHATQTRTRLALLDGPEDLEAILPRLRPPRSPNAALYIPWLLVHDPISRELVRVPPSGFMAGLMARVAAERGPHKAPANEAIFGIAGVSHMITQAEQDILHPRSLNAIRKLPHLEGVRPWGAKTLAERDPFRTIAAFRVFAHVVRSIEQGTTWLLGSSSEPPTWAAFEEAGRTFLAGLHEQGVLAGDRADEAFAFDCNGETNPPAQRERGLVMASVGLALTAPGRFYTFQMGLDLHLT